MKTKLLLLNLIGLLALVFGASALYSQTKIMHTNTSNYDSITSVKNFPMTPTPILVACQPPPTPTPTVCDTYSNDIDCDGILNVNDGDADGDGILNENDPNDDNDAYPDYEDSSPGGPGTDQGSWGYSGCPQCWCNGCPTNTPTPTATNTPTFTMTQTPTQTPARKTINPFCYVRNTSMVWSNTKINTMTNGADGILDQVKVDLDTSPSITTDTLLTTSALKIAGPNQTDSFTHAWDTYKTAAIGPVNAVLVSSMELYDPGSGDYQEGILGLYINNSTYHLLLVIGQDGWNYGWIFAHENGHLLGEPDVSTWWNLMNGTYQLGGNNLTSTQISNMWSKALQLFN